MLTHRLSNRSNLYSDRCSFAVHCWGNKFGDLVAAVCANARTDRYVWIDIFAVRQWPGNVADIVAARSVISKIDGAVIVVMPPMPFRYLTYEMIYSSFLPSFNFSSSNMHDAFLVYQTPAHGPWSLLKMLIHFPVFYSYKVSLRNAQKDMNCKELRRSRKHLW